MSLLAPKLSILDETDSGLDIDALRIVADGVNTLRDNKNSFLIITHYQRLLDYIKPDFVHVLMNGKIVKSGGPDLATELEKKGYEISGEILFENKNLFDLETEERAHKGIFLAFQYPLEIPGVNTNIF